MNLRIYRVQENRQERSGEVKKGEIVPLGEVHIHTAVWFERNALGLKERTLLFPNSGCTALRIDHAVAGQSGGSGGTTQETPHQTGMVRVASQQCHLPVSKHPAIRNGSHNTIDILAKSGSINGHGVGLSA